MPSSLAMAGAPINRSSARRSMCCCPSGEAVEQMDIGWHPLIRCHMNYRVLKTPAKPRQNAKTMAYARVRVLNRGVRQTLRVKRWCTPYFEAQTMAYARLRSKNYGVVLRARALLVFDAVLRVRAPPRFGIFGVKKYSAPRPALRSPMTSS